jgi:hypothetical protein
MPEWVDRAREARVLVQASPTAGISRVVSAMPWPLADREAIVAWTLRQDAARGVVTLEGEAADWPGPPTAGRVRMPAHRSSWRLRPLEGGGVEAVFEGWADLGGHLNATPLRAFVRAALWQAPAATMAGLRRMVQRPVYRDARDARQDLVRDGAP